MGTQDRGEAYFQTWTDDVFDDDQPLYRMFLDVTKGYVRGDVLDLGCGSRIYYDTSEVKHWVGIDLSPHLLGKIRFLGGDEPSGPIETRQSDCSRLDFPDASFDVVCAIFIFHHLARVDRKTSEEIIIATMREAHRVLRPGGTLLVLESWPHILLHIYAALYPVLYPLARRVFRIEIPLFFTARRFSTMAAEAGFAVRHIFSTPIYDSIRYPIGGFMPPGWFQWFTHKFGLYYFKKT